MRDRSRIKVLSQNIGFGMTSVKSDECLIQRKIKRSEQSIAGQIPWRHRHYWFGLECLNTKQLVGWMGVSVQADDLFFKKNIQNLDVSHMCGQTEHSEKAEIIYLKQSSQLKDCHLLGSLFLLPQYRAQGLGTFLSYARFLFLAAQKKYFKQPVIAEMRGVSDAGGISPFFESLIGKKIDCSFEQLDHYRAYYGYAALKKILPKYPVRVDHLSCTAQRALGQVHPETRMAKKLLLKQNFQQTDYYDILDGGPVLRARISEIPKIQEAVWCRVETNFKQTDQTPQTKNNTNGCFVSNGKIDFRVICVPAYQKINQKIIYLTRTQMKVLQLNKQDPVIVFQY